MAANVADYSDYIVYGPETICTLALCPVQLSVYQYQPTLAGNIAFLVLFAIAMMIHMKMKGGNEEIKSKTDRRIQVYITLAPAFYTAAIYITLYKIILYLGPKHARFPPKAYYWIFIPCASSPSQVAVNVSIAGLSFQVFTLLIFIALTLEFSFRWRKARRANPDRKRVSRAFKIFVWFLSLSILFILIRCIYRIDELSEGYSGPLISNEGLFIAL
ncbi:MAG: hypothetical protein Q9188_001708 [Gyalolechia gomerana]